MHTFLKLKFPQTLRRLKFKVQNTSSVVLHQRKAGQKITPFLSGARGKVWQYVSRTVLYHCKERKEEKKKPIESRVSDVNHFKGCETHCCQLSGHPASSTPALIVFLSVPRFRLHPQCSPAQQPITGCKWPDSDDFVCFIHSSNVVHNGLTWHCGTDIVEFLRSVVMSSKGLCVCVLFSLIAVGSGGKNLSQTASQYREKWWHDWIVLNWGWITGW